MNKKCVEDLCNAIILQSVEDYRKETNKKKIKELEDFFLSDYFKKLTKISGKWLLYKLRKEKN